MAARVLATVRKGEICIRILNPTSTPVKLYQRTTIGTITEIDTEQNSKIFVLQEKHTEQNICTIGTVAIASRNYTRGLTFAISEIPKFIFERCHGHWKDELDKASHRCRGSQTNT